MAVVQAVADAFGNALGQSVAGAASPDDSPYERTLGIPQTGWAAPTASLRGEPPPLFTSELDPVFQTAVDVMKLEDDSRILSDSHDSFSFDELRTLQLAMRTGALVASGMQRGSEYSSESESPSTFAVGGVDRMTAGERGLAGRQLLEGINEVLRETRGGAASRAAMYRDLAVSGALGNIDPSSQRSVLATMVAYADTLSQGVFADDLESRTADVAVRYAADLAKQSGAIPQTFRFASDARLGALAGVLLLHAPLRKTYEGASSRVSGETEATAIGKSYHAQRAAERRASGEYDMVNQPFVGADGRALLVTRRVDLRTGEPLVSSGVQTARPDSVVFRRSVVIDDKPVGRPMNKDQQEILRFVRAYEQQFGAPPRTIAIERYDPKTMQPVFTELYRPSDFPLGRR